MWRSRRARVTLGTIEWKDSKDERVQVLGMKVVEDNEMGTEPRGFSHR